LGLISTIASGLFGKKAALPDAVVEQWPELSELRYRRGGLPVRVGGWFLGQSTVAAITLGRTIFLAPRTRFDPELLLHELKHVHQFSESKSFPLHYIWESLRRGYHMNRFEVDARSYASRQIARANENRSSEDA
jgi:hypothetical protein